MVRGSDVAGVELFFRRRVSWLRIKGDNETLRRDSSDPESRERNNPTRGPRLCSTVPLTTSSVSRMRLLTPCSRLAHALADDKPPRQYQPRSASWICARQPHGAAARSSSGPLRSRQSAARGLARRIELSAWRYIFKLGGVAFCGSGTRSTGFACSSRSPLGWLRAALLVPHRESARSPLWVMTSAATGTGAACRSIPPSARPSRPPNA